VGRPPSQERKSDYFDLIIINFNCPLFLPSQPVSGRARPETDAGELQGGRLATLAARRLPLERANDKGWPAARGARHLLLATRPIGRPGRSPAGWGSELSLGRQEDGLSCGRAFLRAASEWAFLRAARLLEGSPEMKCAPGRRNSDYCPACGRPESEPEFMRR